VPEARWLASSRWQTLRRLARPLDRLVVEPYYINRASIEPYYINRASIEPYYINRALMEPYCINRASIEPCPCLNRALLHALIEP
jgi:hypothetical protein